MHPPHATVVACSQSLAGMLPPQHPDTLRGKTGGGAPKHRASHLRGSNLPMPGSIQQVYSADATKVICFRAEHVTHVPRTNLHVKKLVLCAHFRPSCQPATTCNDSCPKGDRCKYVHTTFTPTDAVATLPTFTVHNNNAWRSLDDVEYPRHAGGSTVEVALPDGSATVHTLDTANIIRTAALSDAASGDPNLKQLRHCAHYFYNRACILGPDCHFVHAVFLDPKANKNQRAPAPHTLVAAGLLPAVERPETAPHRRESNPQQRTSEDPLCTDCEVSWIARPTSSIHSPTVHSSAAARHSASFASETERSWSSGEASAASTPCPDLAPIAAAPLSATVAANTTATAMAGRVRHDPYSSAGWRPCGVCHQ